MFCRYRVRISTVWTRLVDGRFGVRISAGPRDFSVLRNFQTFPGAHPVSYPIDTDVLLRWQSYRSVNLNTRLSSDEVRNEWNNTFAPPLCFHVVGRDMFTFLPHNIGQFVIRTRGRAGTTYIWTQIRKLFVMKVVFFFKSWRRNSLYTFICLFGEGDHSPLCSGISHFFRLLELVCRLQMNRPTRCSNFSDLLLDV